MTFFVFQATRTATKPASNWGLRHDKSSVPLGLVKSGRMIAESTATGTKRKPRLNQSGTLIRSRRKMKERRVPKVSKPAMTITIQMFISAALRSAILSRCRSRLPTGGRFYKGSLSPATRSFQPPGRPRRLPDPSETGQPGQ